jgi:hypothetical protein
VANRNRAVQGAVTCGVWWCLFVDVLGNFDGQGHGACWLPIITGCAVVLIFVHLLAVAGAT